MIKINLLPSQILEQGKVKAWLYASAAAIVVAAVVLLLVTLRLNSQLADEQARKAYWEAEAAKVGTVQGLVARVKGETGPFMAWNAFFDAVPVHNSKIAELLEAASRSIYKGVQLSSLSIAGAAVNMNGVADNLDEVTIAYTNLMQSPVLLKETVTLSTVVPPWMPGQPTKTTARGLPSTGGQVPVQLAAVLTADWAGVFVPPVPPAVGAAATGVAPTVPGGAFSGLKLGM